MIHYPHTFSGRRASQSKYELESFINLLFAHDVTRYAEIGAREGDTFWEVMTHLPKGSHGVAVDLPGGLWGKSTTIFNLRKAIDDLRERGYNVTLVQGDSSSPVIVEMVRGFGPFDAMLIDGDHTYKGVKADWDAYRDMAPMIAFHDIVGTGQFERKSNQTVEVPKLWEEIKTQAIQGDYFTTEFIDAESKMGIGVVLK